MTNSAPQLMPTFARLRRARLWPLFALIPLGVLSGIVGGALMNAFDVVISPLYFQYHGYWINRTQSEGLINILQEGMVAGGGFCIMSVSYVFGIVVHSRGRCPFHLALRGFKRCVLLLFAIYFAMGLNAAMLLIVAPSLFRRFVELPSTPGLTQFDLLRWVWVGGSIVGLHIGNILSVIIAIIWFSFDWRKYKREHSL